MRNIDEVSAAFQVESLAKHGTTAIPQAVAPNLFYGTLDRFVIPNGVRNLSCVESPKEKEGFLTPFGMTA